MSPTTFALVLLLSGSPTGAPRQPEGHRALAYNVLYDGADDEASIDAIASVDADVVCLREVTRAFQTKANKALRERYPHRRFEAKRSGTWGLAILSKHPVERFSTFRQRPHRLPAGEALVRIGERTLLVVCVHWIPPVAKHRKSDDFFASMAKNEAMRAKQAQYLVRRYARERRPILVLGDFNESEDDDGVRYLLSKGYADACTAPSEDCGATWPGATSLMPATFRIDHVLGRGVVFDEAGVVREGGSDHYPVFARFHFETPR